MIPWATHRVSTPLVGVGPSMFPGNQPDNHQLNFSQPQRIQLGHRDPSPWSWWLCYKTSIFQKSLRDGFATKPPCPIIERSHPGPNHLPPLIIIHSRNKNKHKFLSLLFFEDGPHACQGQNTASSQTPTILFDEKFDLHSPFHSLLKFQGHGLVDSRNEKIPVAQPDSLTKLSYKNCCRKSLSSIV